MVKLQPIKKDDVRQILKIITGVDKEDGRFAESYFQFYTDERTSEHRFDGMFKVVSGEEVIGCIGYSQRWGDNVYEIIWMYLNEDNRCRGIGSLVLEQIEEKLAKKHARLLVVETGRQRAINFYEKNGFKLEGKINDFYRENEHSWLLSKKM